MASVVVGMLNYSGFGSGALARGRLVVCKGRSRAALSTFAPQAAQTLWPSCHLCQAKHCWFNSRCAKPHYGPSAGAALQPAVLGSLVRETLGLLRYTVPALALRAVRALREDFSQIYGFWKPTAEHVFKVPGLILYMIYHGYVRTPAQGSIQNAHWIADQHLGL